MTRTPAERKSDERARMRARGYVLRQIWVHPNDWERVRKYLARDTRREAAKRVE